MNIQFAYWLPNVSGGLVISRIPQKTDWSFNYNAELAQIAEQVGFDYGLAQTRFGTVEQVADRIRRYYEIGVDLILCGFLHYIDDLPTFGRTVIPLVRSMNARKSWELVGV